MLVDDKDKIKRITFSKSLAEHIIEKCPDQNLRLERATFITGQELQPGETSCNGLYAIMSRDKNIVLRICLIKDLAPILLDDSRFIAECWLVP